MNQPTKDLKIISKTLVKSSAGKGINSNKKYPNKNIICFMVYMHTILITHIQLLNWMLQKQTFQHSTSYCVSVCVYVCDRVSQII